MEDLVKEDEYQCAVCHGVYKFIRDETWSMEKALQELKSYFGNIPIKDCEVVCDDCWQFVRPRSDTRTT